jgi:hypothetical protein
MLWIAGLVAACFIWLRRGRIIGLEVSVYWAGFVLLFFWGTINSVAGITAVAELDASVFGNGNGYRAAATLLAVFLPLRPWAFWCGVVPGSRGRSLPSTDSR